MKGGDEGEGRVGEKMGEKQFREREMKGGREVKGEGTEKD